MIALPQKKKFIHPEQGERLKKLIKDNGLTQDKFGELFNFDQRTISNYCRSTRELSVDTAWRIAEKFGVNPNWLLCKSEEMYIAPDDFKLESAVHLMDENITVDKLLRSWDADITVESMIQKVLGDLGYSIVRSGDTRFITDEKSEMPLPDRDYNGAYNILDSAQRKLGRCSMNDFDDFTEDIVDYIEFRFQKLLVKAQSNSKGVKQNGKK